MRMTDDAREFARRNRQYIEALGSDKDLQLSSLNWMKAVSEKEYSYHFRWMGLPIIQYPQDIIAMQEIIWDVKPDLIIETGVARGGSLVFYASMLEMMGIDGEVVGIDIDIRDHNREAIEDHPMSKRITMLEGSSVDEAIVQQVEQIAQGKQQVLVILDSLHTQDHVLKELAMYSPLVTKGSYLVVLDTIIELMPPEFSVNRPWNPGNSPKSAVHEFLKQTDRFEIDEVIPNKLLITVAPDGYLKCIKELNADE